MKNIAFVYSGDKDGLSSLEPDRNEVERVLSTYGEWDKIINEELENINQFETTLKNYENKEIENLFFYFTGHGVRDGISTKDLYLDVSDENSRNMNEFILSIFNTNIPKRIAIVLDTCYSGTYVYNSKIISGSFEILTSSSQYGKSSAKSSSDLSLFTRCFCKSIEKLHKTSTPITLQAIHEDIKEELKPQKSLPSSPILLNGNMTIVKNSPTDDKESLKSIQKNLKIVVPKISTLRKYANNLLSNYLNRADLSVMEYNEIVEHLYDLRKPLLCLLYNLNSDVLQNDFKILKNEFIEYGIDGCCSLEKMQHEELNLLITLEPEDDDISRTKATIWEYKKPYASDKADMIVDLSSSNPIDFIDKIFSVVNVSESSVLLEFIMPYELIDIDMTQWTTTHGENLVETYRVVRRISERMERLRGNEGKIKSWNEFWTFYKKNCNKNISETKLPSNKTIRFKNFEKTPYIRLQEQLSIEALQKIVNTSASIVMTPTEKYIDTLGDECEKIQDAALNSLVEKGFEYFCDIPHILIWDNPNRQLRKKHEVTGE